MTAVDLENAARHPLDPEVVPSTKANAVFALGIVAAVTGAFVGGVLPATIALMLARPVEEELRAARGYLSGAKRLRWGVRLAWVGIVLAIAAVVTAAIIGLLHLAGTRGTGSNFAPGTD